MPDHPTQRHPFGDLKSRSLEWIIEHADEIADWFEQHDFDPDGTANWHVEALRRLHEARDAIPLDEQALVEAVAFARADGLDWASISLSFDFDPEATRRRFAERIGETAA